MFGSLFNPRKSATSLSSDVGILQQMPQSGSQTAPDLSSADSSSLVSSSMNPANRQNITVLSHLDPRSTQVLTHAQSETQKIKKQFIEPEQLILGLLYDVEIYRLLTEENIDVSKLSSEIQSKISVGNYPMQPTLSTDSQKIFEQAYDIAKKREASFIAPEDILLSIFSTAASSILSSHGVARDMVEKTLSKKTEYVVGHKSILEKFGIDLCIQAKEGLLDPLTGRDRETERLIHILLRRTKNNPIIIGEAGVGKTAIVENLAEKIVAGLVPEALLNKRIILLEVSSLVAGASHRGEFEERLRDVIREIQISNGKIILFIDEIHTLIGTGGEGGALDASNIIKPFLTRGQIQIIGTTTTSEYRKYIERDKAFERRFQPVLVEEPSEEVAVEMMKTLAPKYEKFHNVTIGQDALTASVHLSKKYIGERFLPDKSVDLLDEAAAQVKLEYAAKKRPDNAVKQSDIERIVSSWTGIPITKLTEDEGQKLLHLEDLVHKRLIDQEEAVTAVAEAVRRGRIGLASPTRPIASFLFLGPTGTGKTELAKTLAEILFGRDDATIRLDMSEYMEKHEVAKLIGAPPGYVGYEEGGQLTEAVRRKPYSIVLLDEVEKAHPDVFNILLQVLEDGRLTDNRGNTISFKNTVIIATSNIGSALIQEKLSSETGEIKVEDFDKKFVELSKIVTGELHKFFRPELLNRIDEIVIFKPLNPHDMTYIAKLGIGKTQKLLVEQGINIKTTDAAIAQLARDGYDPQYGARPLRRLVQSTIENPIALSIIGKQFVSGDTVTIDFNVQTNEFTFTKLQPQTVESNVVRAPQPQMPPIQNTPPVQQVPNLNPQSSYGFNPQINNDISPDGTQMQKAPQ